MKKLIYFVMLNLAFVLLNSCSNDDSQENTNWAANFIGNLSASETCDATSVNPGNVSYNTIFTRVDNTTLSSKNLFGYGTSNVIEINVISANEIKINYTDVANRVFTGTGTKTNNKLTINYTCVFPNNQGTDTCTTVITYDTIE